jgi:hypothetical protein
MAINNKERRFFMLKDFRFISFKSRKKAAKSGICWENYCWSKVQGTGYWALGKPVCSFSSVIF